MSFSRSILASVIIFFWSTAWAVPALEQLNSNHPYETSKTNQLTLLTYSALTPLQWNSPGELVRSVIWNTVTMKAHPMAHVDVFLRCENEKPMLSGMSRVKTWQAYKEVFLDGSTLNMLTAVFPGKLLQNQTVLEYLKPAIERGHVRALTFNITKNNCNRLLSYYKEYVQREYYKKYSGFTSNVYAGEGAGCAAYAMSYLQVAGLLDDVFRQAWSRQLSVPVHLLEKEKHPPSAWSYVFGLNASWAGANDEAKTLIIYDPEKMYQWLGDQTQQPFLSPIDFEVEHIGKAVELTVDGIRKDLTDDYWKYQWPN